MNGYQGRTGEISAWLQDQIRGGAFRKGSKIPSEYELAEQFGVNKTTANKAVGELVAKGYLRRCRGAAGTVVTRDVLFPVGTIGFYLSLGTVSYYTRLFAGAHCGAFGRGYGTMFFDSAASCDQRYFLECLRGSGVSGLLVSHLNWVPKDFPFPVVYINDVPDGDEFSSVSHDNLEGGLQVGRHLVRLGHRRAVFIRQNNVAQPLADRYEGFCQAFGEVGVERVPQFIFDGQRARVEHTWERIRADYPGVTAIACDGDNLAIQFYHHLRKVGVAVPEQISLTGFSSLPEVQRLVRITTMDEKPDDIGYHAADVLIDLIEGKRPGPLHEKVMLELLIGDTTCPPPSIPFA